MDRRARLAARPVRDPGAPQARRWSRSSPRPSRDEQLALIRAHPELAGKAMVEQDADRRIDQRAGQGRPHRLHARRVRDDPAAQRRLQREVRLPVHPRGARPARHGPAPRREIIATFERRLRQPSRTSSSARRCATSTASPSSASTTSSASSPTLGNAGLGLARAAGARTPTRATPRRASSPSPTSPTRTAPARSADRAAGCARLRLRRGGDRRGRQRGRPLRRRRRRGAKTLLTGSHYDTVRNGGKYDGRLGIFVPMACVRELQRARPPPALRASRSSASPKRKASATRRPSSARAR